MSDYLVLNRSNHWPRIYLPGIYVLKVILVATEISRKD